jgi:penicillin-binding protein 1A
MPYADGGAYLKDAPERQWPGWEYAPRRRRGRWLRRLRRLAAVVVALFLLGTIVFTGLMFVTPSVGNAPELARAIDWAHGAAYPGPPVPSRFSGALVATEDHRFYSELGIDPFAVARVTRAKLIGGQDQGGATLYQQLAKMLYTPGKSGFAIEVEQVMLGIKLRFAYSRAQILRMYADVAYFGHGFYGLLAASCGYFGKAPAQLSWPQAALLAGMVQAPSPDDPLVHYANARAREAHVLGRLVATGRLTDAQAAQAYRQPLDLVHARPAGCAGG